MSSTTYRYHVDAEGTIFRASIYRLPDDWESWRDYWEYTEIVGFYDEGFRGLRSLDTNAKEGCERAMAAHTAEKNGEKGAEGGLDRLGKRIWQGYGSALTGATRFICVNLSPGTDLYVLSWDGDPENVWRDEIEACYNGEIYRVQTEQYIDGLLGEPGQWLEADDYCDQWYGEDNAKAGLAESYPLTEFPAELLVL